MTKDDRCSSGTCVGTPYNCLSCETHDGSGCPIKSGYCIIQHGGQRTCYAKNHYKPGNPCQVRLYLLIYFEESFGVKQHWRAPNIHWKISRSHNKVEALKIRLLRSFTLAESHRGQRQFSVTGRVPERRIRFSPADRLLHRLQCCPARETRHCDLRRLMSWMWKI